MGKDKYCQQIVLKSMQNLSDYKSMVKVANGDVREIDLELEAILC